MDILISCLLRKCVNFFGEKNGTWTDTTYTRIIFIFHPEGPCNETWSLPRRCATLWIWFGREALGKLQRQWYEKVTIFLPLLKYLPKCALPKQVFSKKYCQVAAAWSKAVPLLAQNQDLIPCWTLRSSGGQKKVARASWASFYSNKRAEGKRCSY